MKYVIYADIESLIKEIDHKFKIIYKRFKTIFKRLKIIKKNILKQKQENIFLAVIQFQLFGHQIIQKISIIGIAEKIVRGKHKSYNWF